MNGQLGLDEILGMWVLKAENVKKWLHHDIDIRHLLWRGLSLSSCHSPLLSGNLRLCMASRVLTSGSMPSMVSRPLCPIVKLIEP